jgi:hypothetical protein
VLIFLRFTSVLQACRTGSREAFFVGRKVRQTAFSPESAISFTLRVE